MREDFRERWSEHYRALRAGADPADLADRKAELIAEQKAVLDSLRSDACDSLREYRNDRYRGLLDDQRAIRAELRTRQEEGLDSTNFLRLLGDKDADKSMADRFRGAADEVTQADRYVGPEASVTTSREMADERSAIENSGSDAGSYAGFRKGLGVGAVFDSVFTFLTGGASAPPPRATSEELFRAAAEETQKREQREREREEEESRQRQRALYGE